jgi:formylglycine-generating enzyme required for sulfatase activity
MREESNMNKNLKHQLLVAVCCSATMVMLVENCLAGESAPNPAIAPFAAAQAKGYAETWAAHFRVAVERTNSVGMKLKLIPPGEFNMGATQVEIDRFVSEARQRQVVKLLIDLIQVDAPQHRVKLTRPFYCGAHEVTVGQFRQFVNATGFQTDAEKEGAKVLVYDPPATWKGVAGLNWQTPGIPQDDSHPVVAVSWNDAVAFCVWLSGMERTRYRLPTEAEWEFACRAGTTTAWYVGDDPSALRTAANIADQSYRRTHPSAMDVASWDDGFAYTSPAGRFQPNAFGLYDMHGNVWERCQDWWDAKYYEHSPTVDPTGPDAPVAAPVYGGCKVARGSAFDVGSYSCRSGWHKGADTPSGATQYTGFRVVCEVMKETGK